MAKLREADKALKEAEGRVQDAIAAIKNAKAAQIAAQMEADKLKAKLENEKLQAESDEARAKADAAIAELERQEELNAFKHAEAVARAEAEYEKAMTELEREMRDFRLAAKDLTPKEKQMLISSAAAYVAAQQAVAEQVFVVMQKEQDLKEIEAKIEMFKASAEPGTIFETKVERNAKLDELTEAIKDLKKELKSLNEEIAEADAKTIKDAGEWLDVIKRHEDRIAELKDATNERIASVAFYYQATVHDGVLAIDKAIKDFVKLNPEPAKDAKEDEVAEFEAAMKAFVGTHVDEKTEKEVYNIEYKNLASWLTVTEFKGNDTENIVAYVKALAEKFYEVNKLGEFAKDEYGNYVPKVGGELYDTFVADFYGIIPMLEKWEDLKNEHAIRHEEILLEGAQAAALVVAQANKFVEEFGEVTIDSENYDEWADLVDAFNEAKETYVSELEEQVEELEDAIEELKAQKKAVEENDITFYYEMEYARAYAGLEKAKQVQNYLDAAATKLSTIYHNIFDMVSENYEGVIDFSSLLGLDIDNLGSILEQAGHLNGVFADFMEQLGKL